MKVLFELQSSIQYRQVCLLLFADICNKDKIPYLGSSSITTGLLPRAQKSFIKYLYFLQLWQSICNQLLTVPYHVTDLYHRKWKSVIKLQSCSERLDVLLSSPVPGEVQLVLPSLPSQLSMILLEDCSSEVQVSTSLTYSQTGDACIDSCKLISKDLEVCKKFIFECVRTHKGVVRWTGADRRSPSKLCSVFASIYLSKLLLDIPDWHCLTGTWSCWARAQKITFSAVLHEFCNLLETMKTENVFKMSLACRKLQQQLWGVISGWNSRGLFCPYYLTYAKLLPTAP